MNIIYKMLHGHNFKESTTDPQILFCECGEIKDLKPITPPHEHKWEKENNITRKDGGVTGFVLKCEKCGERKNHDINDKQPCQKS